jgi:hypothetical protein
MTPTVEKLTLPHSAIIVLRDFPADRAAKVAMQFKKCRQNFTVFTLTSGQTIEALDQDEMARKGWIRPGFRPQYRETIGNKDVTP